MKHTAASCRLAFAGLTLVLAAFVAVCGDMGVATIEDEDGAVADDDRRRRDAAEAPDSSEPSDGSDPSDSSVADDATTDAATQDAGHPADTGYGDAGHPGDGGHPWDAGHADGGHGDAGHGDSGHGDTGQADGGQPGDSGHTVDAGHPDSGAADAGHGDSGGPADAGATCTLNTGDVPCDICLEQHCNSQCVSCENNPACVSVFECGLLCDPTDTACLDACGRQYPGGAWDGAALYNCAVSNCRLQCAPDADGGTVTDAGLPFDAGFLPDGGSVICGLDWGTQQCSACFHTACSSQCQNCAKNADCVSALMCIAQCPQGDLQCMNGCASQYPGSFSLLMALYNCMSGNCGPQCGL
jgi:hypothetical protein